MAHSVMLVSGEAATVQAVAAALQSNGQLAREDVCRDLNELSARLLAKPAPAVVVDVGGEGGGVLAMLDGLVRQFPETRFVVLANEMDPKLMLEAMQAGARHFLIKADVQATLCDVLRRLCLPAKAGTSGQVVSVFSASGGCGATTIAVNLACELFAAAGRSTLLVDLDYAYGGVAAYLGVEGTYGVMELQERTGSIDPELIATSTVAYGETLKVLTSAPANRLGHGAGYGRLRDTMQACAQAASLVVVDAPRLPLETAAELARISTTNLLVLQLNVKDVRSARSMLGALHARGISPDSFTLLVNRYRRRGTPLDIEEARRVLQGTRLECLSNDFSAASEGMNFGQPLEKIAPRSSFRKDLQQLAGRLLPVAAPVHGVHI